MNYGIIKVGKRQGEGMLVDVGERRIFLDRAGEGGPVVVLESGSDWGSDAWDAIWPRLQSFTTVCRYDRAGLGRSAPAPGPHTGADAVADLHRALRTAKVPGPYVLVGHSFGGLLTRLYAHRHRGEVVGLVLVDASHHDQYRRMLSALPAPDSGESEALTQLRTHYTDAEARTGEGFRFADVLAEVSAAGDLGDLPLVVIGRSLPADDEALMKRRPGLPPDTGWALEHTWQAMQQDLLSLSARSRFVLAEGSGHLVQIERPDLVVQTVLDLVESL